MKLHLFLDTLKKLKIIIMQHEEAILTYNLLH